MAGPSMIGIRDVINPVDDLQDSVSRVGDIYRNYEQDRRASQLHTEQMAEFERKENARQYLNSYTPELGGTDFKGIDAETKKAMVREEEQILKSLGPDATPDEYRRVTDEITRRRAQLVTREAVTADVYSDLIRNNVDPATAQNLANIEGSKHESLESRFTSAAEAGKLEEERLLKRGELAAKWLDARKPPRTSTSTGSTNVGGVSAERGSTVFKTAAEAEQYLEDKVGYGWLDGDHKSAIDNINAAIDLVNRDRSGNGKKPIGIADISNLIQYSVTSDKTDNDVVYQSTGEWKKAIEGYVNSLGNPNGSGSSFGGVVPTAYEEAAIIAALRGVKGNAPTRADIIARRVRGVYGDLYKTLKTTEATEDSGIRILGGTGNSGQRKGSGNSQNTGTAGGSSTSNTGNTNTSSKNTTTRESRLLPVNESPLPPELAERKEDTQARIRAITDNPGGVKLRNAYVLRKLESQLKDIEEQENVLRKEQSRPRVDAAYKAAVDARVGTNVPKDLYTHFRPTTLDQYSTNQLQKLEGTVVDEYNNYRAVLEHAELTGNRRAASDARSRMLRLRRVSEDIDRRLGRTRLPE